MTGVITVNTNATAAFDWELTLWNGFTYDPFLQGQSVNAPPFNTFTIPGLFAGKFELTTYPLGQAGTLGSLIDIETDIDVIQPGPITIFGTPTIADVNCFGGNDGSISLFVIGGVGPYVYSWLPGGSNSNPNTNLSAGSYICTITDANFCTQTTPSLVVSEPAAALSANISTNNNVSCFAGSDGSATVNEFGGTSPYTYLWSNGQTSQTAINLPTGTYSCTITDANLCTFTTSSVLITQPAAALSVLSSTNNVSCFGLSDGQATANPSGGTAGYTFLWSNGQTSQTAINLSAGTYTCTVNDANSCPISITVNITQPAAPLVATAVITSNYNGEDISCSGVADGIGEASGTDGTPPYSYLWSDGQTTAQATGLDQNIYSCIVTDANGCSETSNSIGLNAPPIVVGTATSLDATCFNLNDGTATVTPVGGTPTYSYLWDNGQITQTATALLSGTYNCTITDANGCIAIVSESVGHPTELFLGISPLTNVSCNGGSDGTATVVPSGGTPGYSYLWQSGQNTATATGLSYNQTTGYTCTVTDANGCPKNITVFIDQPTSALTAVSNSSIVSCYNGSNGTATVVPIGGTPGFTYLWSDGQTTAQATGLSAGTYSCTVTDANGCTFTISQTVNEPNIALNVNPTSITNILCNGQSNGSATVFPTGGVPGYFYSWTGPFPITTVISTTSSIFGQPSGIYVCTVTDAAGCPKPVTVTITEPAVLGFTLPVVANNPLCPLTNTGDATVIPLGGTPPYLYLWSDGQLAPTASALTAGNYTCTVTDANGCSPASGSIPVTLVDPPSISVNSFPSNVLCTGGVSGSISLNVSGGTQFSPPSESYHYLWSNGTTTSNNNLLTAGSYTCQITDANGCVVNTGIVNITEPTTPLSASIINVIDETCFGLNTGSLEASVLGGTLAYSYSWTGGSTGPVASGLSPGIYTCTVTDGNGCSFTTAPATISAASQLNVSTNPASPSCNSTTIGIANNGTATATVNGGTGIGTYSYLWSDILSQTTSTAIGLITGTYSVMVTDANGCTAPSVVTVPEPSPDIIANFNTIDVDCFGGNTGSITMNIIGGTPPLNYFWIPTGETTSTIQNLSAGTYTCNVSDITGCITVVSTTILENSLFTSPITVNQMTVLGANDGNMFVLPNGGVFPYTYNWFNNNDPTTTIGTTSSISLLSPGTYTCTVTDAAGCTIQVQGLIADPGCALTVTDNISTVDCYGDLANVSWTNSNGLAPYTNTLIDPNGVPVDLISTYGTDQFPTNSPSPLSLSAGVYLLTVTDANGCFGNNVAQINLQVIEPDSITLNFTTTDVACHADQTGNIVATAAGGTSPLTTTFAVQSTGIPANPAALFAGTYSITITDINGCLKSDTFTITEPASPLSLTSNSTAEGCMPTGNGTASVIASGGTPAYTYLWTDFLSQTTPTASSLSFGVYSCTVTDLNGCTANIIEPVPSAPALSLTYTSTDPTCSGANNGSITTVYVSGSAPISYNWQEVVSPGVTISTNNSITALPNGMYTLDATDFYGCTFSTPAISISEPAPISWTWGTVSDPSLNGACDGSVSINLIDIVGGNGSYTYQWIGTGGFTATTKDISFLCDGTYELTISDGIGCTGTQLVNIIDPACNVSSTFVLNQPTCCGLAGDLTWNNTGGQGPYQTSVYQYGGLLMHSSISSPPLVPVSLLDGDYYMIVVDNLGCSAQINNIIVTEPACLTVALQIDSVTCNGLSDGQATATVSGGTAPYNYSWASDPLNNTAIENGLSAGISNSLTVTDVNGCQTLPSALISFNIPEPNAITIAPIIFTQPSCNLSTNGTGTATITGGTGSYSYLWSNSGETTNPAVALSAGSQSLIVTDFNNCSQTLVQTLTQPAPLSITLSANNVTCFGGATGNITATPTGGTAPYYYLWSNGATTSFITGLAVGTYTCTVIDDNGCANTVSETITEGSEILSNLSTNDITCFGANDGFASVAPTGGSGGYNVIWWDPLLSTNTVSGLFPAAGTYWVQVVDASNPSCSSGLDTFTISEPAALSASSIETLTSCNGSADGSIIFTPLGGTAPYTYTLLDVSGIIVAANNSGIFLSLQAGDYTCNIIDNNLCPYSTPTTTVMEPAPIAANEVITSISCNGGNNGSITVLPTGENDNFTYFWSGVVPANTTTTVNGLSGINYTLVVTPTNGCPASAFTYNMALYEPLPITLTSTTTPIQCFGSTSNAATITATGGNGGYSYLWSDGQLASTATGLSAGTYTCLVTDATGCSQTASVTITEHAQVTQGYTLTNSTCFGANNGTSLVSPTGVSGSAFEVFYNGISSGSTALVPLNPGSYSVEVINTITGCSSGIDIIQITEPNPLTAATSKIDVACNGDLTGGITVTAAGGTAPYTYSLIDASGATVTSNNTGNFSALSAGDYTCEIVDANSCPTFTTPIISILEPTAIVDNMTITDVSCNGISPADGQVSVSPFGGNGSYSYFWSNDVLNATNTSGGYAAATGIYTVSITDVTGCTQVFPFNVNQPAPFTVSAAVSSFYNGSDISCFGASDGEITLTTSGGNALDYYLVNSLISTGSPVGLLPAGTYFVDAYDIRGCYAATSIIINSPAGLQSNCVITDVSCNGAADGSVTVSPTGGTSTSGLYTVNWINFASIPSSYHDYTTIPTYPLTVLSGASVEVIDDNGCITICPVSINENPTLTAPLTFTPTTCNNLDNGLGSSADGTATASPTGGLPPYTYLWNTTPVQTTATATGLIAGTYTCTVTGSNGCTDIQSITVTSPAALATGLTTTAVSCVGLSDGSATVLPTGFQGLYDINWSNASTSSTILALPAFDPASPLTVTVGDLSGNNCGYASDQVVVGTPTSPVTGANNPSLYIDSEPGCNGGANGQINLSSTSGGTAPYTYDWPVLGIFGSSSPLSGYVLSAGNYNVIVTDFNGCTDNFVVTMTEPSAISASITIATNYSGYDIECNGGSNGDLNAVVTGGVPFIGPLAYTYQWTNSSGVSVASATTSVTGLSAGTYAVSGQDLEGCPYSTPVTITDPPAVVFSFVASDYNGFNIDCYGNANGSLIGNVSGGAGGVNMSTYQWEDLSTNPNRTGLIPVPVLPYTLEVYDNNGCFFSDTYIITEPAPLSSTTSTTLTTCYDGPQSMNGTATVTPTGGVAPYTYIWSNASISQTPIALGAGPYSVLITDHNGCTTNDLATVASPIQIISTFTVEDVTCFGGADGALIGLSSTGGAGAPYLYSINSSLPYVPALPAYNGLSAGAFTIVAKDINGCLGDTVEQIIQSSPIAVNIIPSTPLTCLGLDDGEFTAVPTGGSTSNYGFEWSNGFTTSSASNSTISSLSSGTYSVIVTDASGCIGQGSSILTPVNTLSLSFSTNDVSCNGGTDGTATVSLIGGATATNWVWSTPLVSVNSTASGLSAGTYSVTVTDNVGCQVIDDVTIIEPNTNLSISASGNNLDCFNDNSGSVIVAIINNGAGGWSWEWTKVPFTSPFAFTQQVNGLAAGQYAVAVTDINNCTQYDTVTITEPNQLLTTTTINDISCFGDANGELNTNTTGGTSPYSYSWVGPATYTALSASISNLGPGNYNLNVTDVNGCLTATSHTVVEPAILDAVTLVSNVSCNGGTDGSLEITVTGGVLPYDVSYNSFPPTLSSSSTIFEFPSLSAGQGIFTISDANNCALSGNVIITQPNLLEIVSFSVVDPSCFNLNDGLAVLEVIGGVEPYVFEDLLGNPVDLTALSSGTITVKVMDQMLCQEIITLTLVEPLEIGITSESCLNSITIQVDNALGDYATTWTNDDGVVVGTENTITDLSSEQYSVLIIDQPNGCTQSAIFDIELPIINVTDASCSNTNDGSVEITINGNSFYDVFVDGIQIEEDVMFTTATNLGVGIHEIKIVGDGNCEYNTIATIGYVGGYSCLVPPIIISPNADGSNDTWVPAIDVNEDITVTIYNRWGQIEFLATANSLSFEWDGTRTDGTSLPTTDYYFVIEFINNTAADKTGVITLIR
jgi:gliding motility-associated-like protein